MSASDRAGPAARTRSGRGTRSARQSLPYRVFRQVHRWPSLSRSGLELCSLPRATTSFLFTKKASDGRVEGQLRSARKGRRLGRWLARLALRPPTGAPAVLGYLIVRSQKSEVRSQKSDGTWPVLLPNAARNGGP